ncbi:hypothetical protein SLEP1_g30000 [Rubroshorea leprosula]|uniref:Uncharacterized protein n=1 Tax=Rubroshorea leprosula TaxID=152421 RepID=A0AAV5K9L5_9ROSI|nr:hypothetical protein SLEP1_g30000 [Rubroshorea leprosula]
MSLPFRLSLPSPSTFRRTQPPHLTNPKFVPLHRHFQSHSFQRLEFQKSGRIPNLRKGRRGVLNGPCYWGFSLADQFVDEADDEEDEERSLELFIKFLHNTFKKISKRVRKIARSILPISIPTDLLNFAVNGILTLALLWFAKAFLEVACSLGNAVFSSILLIRVLWTALNYLQESRNENMNRLNGDNGAWTTVRPAT